jgi:DNA-binding NtrC family response regulator
MHGMEILVVTSDSARAQALCQSLREGGHLVASEPDTVVAGSQLAGGFLDVVVVDLALPGLDPAGLGRALLPPSAFSHPEPLESVERRHILATLAYTGGNKRRAASLLGIARSTLIQKIRRYEIRLPALPE